MLRSRETAMYITKLAARNAPWLYRAYAETVLFGHAVRNGLWRRFAKRESTTQYGQKVLVWESTLGDVADSTGLTNVLRSSGVSIKEGGHTIYLPPQSAMDLVLPGF